VVEEGVLIAESGVRMTLRNRIIVDALRDRRDFDREALAGVAATALEALADQEWDMAQRSRFGRTARLDDPLEDYDEEDRVESERRETIHEAMSRAFAERAKDEEALASLVERSRVEAWVEIGDFLRERVNERVGLSEVDASYERERNERVATFVALDLAGLAHERGVPLE
jgi:hypothetical protein